MTFLSVDNVPLSARLRNPRKSRGSGQFEDLWQALEIPGRGMVTKSSIWRTSKTAMRVSNLASGTVHFAKKSTSQERQIRVGQSTW